MAKTEMNRYRRAIDVLENEQGLSMAIGYLNKVLENAYK